MKSVYFRNFVFTAGMVLTSFLFLSVGFVFLGRSYFNAEKRDGMEATAREAANSVIVFINYNEEFIEFQLRINIGMISRLTGNRILVCDADGVVMHCSDEEYFCEHIGQKISGRVITAVNESGRINIMGNLDGFYDTRHYVVAQPIKVSQSEIPVGYVFVTADGGAFMAEWSALLRTFISMSLIVLAFAFAMSIVTSRRQAKPLNEMAAASKRFARGDFTARVEDEGRDDEIGALTVSFNKMAESLEQAEELRREFIANISHELKTPMTTISGFADGLLDGTIPLESADRYLETISTETKRLSRLVRRMLDVSQIQSQGVENLRRHEFDIAEVMRRTLFSFEDRITQRGLEIDIQLPEHSIMVLGDSDAITQVVYNLCDNAVKFADTGSTITLSLWKQGSKAYVSVRSAGETIPEQELTQIFDRFHKTDRSRSRDREGVGLGLYLVKSILNNHDEDVFVTSRDGVTEFVFSLTLSMQRAGAAQTLPSQRFSQDGGYPQ